MLNWPSIFERPSIGFAIVQISDIEWQSYAMFHVVGLVFVGRFVI